MTLLLHLRRLSLRMDRPILLVARPTGCLAIAFLVACMSRDDRFAGADSGQASRRAGAAAALGNGYVYTADETGRSISRVDLRSVEVSHIPVGIMPHNVQVAPDGRSVLAVGSAVMSMPAGASVGPGRDAEQEHDDDAAGSLLVLLAGASDTIGAVRIPIGRSPAHVVVSADGRRAFTTNSGDNSVIVVDLAARRVTDTVRVAAFPHGLRLSPDGRELYVACTNANSISVIDVPTLREVARVSVGRAPVQVGFTPDGGRVYVTLRDDNAVAVINARTRRVAATIPVGRSPIQLAATPDGRSVYVANQGTPAAPDSTVSVIDVATNAVITTLRAGRGAHGVAVSADGTRVFIANTFANTVTVIDATQQRVLRNVSVGQGPSGISYKP